MLWTSFFSSSEMRKSYQPLFVYITHSHTGFTLSLLICVSVKVKKFYLWPWKTSSFVFCSCPLCMLKNLYRGKCARIYQYRYLLSRWFAAHDNPVYQVYSSSVDSGHSFSDESPPPATYTNVRNFGNFSRLREKRRRKKSVSISLLTSGAEGDFRWLRWLTG